MRCYNYPRCPTCRRLAIGELDTIQARANIFWHSSNSDGKGNNALAEYTGDTKVFWDTQQTVAALPCHVKLLCECGGEWLTKVSDTA